MAGKVRTPADPSAPAARPSRAGHSGLPARSTADRIVAGVAGGLAPWVGVDTFLVRAAFVLLGMAGGAGLIAYALAWAAMPAGTGRAPERVAPTDERRLAFGALVLGALLLLREAGLWPGDLVAWPVVFGVVGSAVLWATADESERARWARLGLRGATDSGGAGGAVGVARAAVGVLLVTFGMGMFLAANDVLGAVRVAALAVAVTMLGAGLILGPFLARLAADLREERVARIRSQERAEVAAHLHDSVLHTLALMQRAQTAAEMVALARVQERELRAWLYGRETEQGPDRLRRAVDEAASRVERLHGVPVDAVVVGDAALDEPLRALVAAAQEAALNAARHSGASHVSLYVEVEHGAARAWVRDEGKGFEPAAVPPDRRGIADSILGRMARHGGGASVVSQPGEGTEVELWAPHQPEGHE